MSEEPNKNQPSFANLNEHDLKQRQAALKIAKEAVKLANIPQLPPNDEEFTKERWRVSYNEVEQEIVLTIQLNPVFTKAVIHTSLVPVAWGILREMELLLSNQKAIKLSSIEEINPEWGVFKQCVLLTQTYIQHLPLVILHSFHQTLDEVVVGHIKKFIDHDMQEFFEIIGEPRKKFSLLPNDNLSDIIKLMPGTDFNLLKSLNQTNKEFADYRQRFVSDRKGWLTDDVLKELPAIYEKLQQQYKEAKNDYKLQYAAFHSIKRQVNPDEWDNHWEKLFDEKFPELFQANEIKSLTPSQLAYRHLADTYGFKASYMEVMVMGAKAQFAKKALKNKKTDKKE